MEERPPSVIFDTVTLSEGFFTGANRVNCVAPYSGGTRILYGTNDGVYISQLAEMNRTPVRVLALRDVTQVDALDHYQLLIVLSEKQVITFPLDELDSTDPIAAANSGKRITSDASFFKVGFSLNRTLICIAKYRQLSTGVFNKSGQLSTVLKTLEVKEKSIDSHHKPELKLFREVLVFVEATSVYYQKTKLVVTCSTGFEIVDFESLDTQGLLDPDDKSLDFVRNEKRVRPIAIYRVHNHFLLCYNKYAFYVDRHGRLSREELLINWEGRPTAFAFHEPYVLAFEGKFVEVLDIETGHIAQIIQGLHNASPSESNGWTSQHISREQNQHQPSSSLFDPYASDDTLDAHSHSHHTLNTQGVGKDDILIISDDRVVALCPRMCESIDPA